MGTLLYHRHNHQLHARSICGGWKGFCDPNFPTGHAGRGLAVGNCEKEGEEGPGVAHCERLSVISTGTGGEDWGRPA
jgi:hypothetical protein